MQPYIIYDKRKAEKFPDLWMKMSKHLSTGHIQNFGDFFIGRFFTYRRVTAA